MVDSKNLPAVISKAAESQGLALANVNLIMPTETFGAVLGQFDKITIETVRINPSDVRDAYEPNGKGKGFALSKSSLQAIASALTLQWDPRYTGIVESTARKSRAKAVGVMRKPNGEIITQTEEKTIDLDVEEDDLREKATKDSEGGRIVKWEYNERSGKDMPVKEPWKSEAERKEWIENKVREGIKQKRKFKDELALTGAKDRVIRSFLALKSTYTKDELAKPLAFPRVTTDTNKLLADPSMRAAAIDLIAPSAAKLFGSPAPEAVQPIQALTAAQPEAREDDPATSARPVGPGHEEPEESTTPPAAAASEDIDFGYPPIDTTPPTEQEKAIIALQDYLNSDVLNQAQIKVIQGVVENPDTPLDGDGGLRYYLDLCKAQEKQRIEKRRAS